MKSHHLFELVMNYKIVEAEKVLKRLNFKTLLEDKIAELENHRNMHGVRRRILRSGHLSLIN